MEEKEVTWVLVTAPPTLVKRPWASSEINLTLENKSVSQESD